MVCIHMLWTIFLDCLGTATFILNFPCHIWKDQPPGCPVNFHVSLSLGHNLFAFHGSTTGLAGPLCSEHATPSAQRTARWMFRLLCVWSAILLQRTAAYLLRLEEAPRAANATAGIVANATRLIAPTDAANTGCEWNNFILFMYVMVPLIFLWECTVWELFPQQRPGFCFGCAYCNSRWMILFGRAMKIVSVGWNLYAVGYLLTLT
ncbi:uncharacterized protein LOC129588778 [Paramacrobiotus metropolitanus]|uniref:uncharacterized protein LOC129588778 n=1 Tax=Paramacrobiotus metropolitanus TaxID=2943436 RepID=UPI0024459720|nr:uncharacterized protein LOC129588778 [Paramacrobiotus metropolitanus]XP_055339129.1 uncharacterized protein LOC129588778 [Paramacrobiotus metropolitanus]XP_055339130.1 uncharacterized protein LOC129588778 [Paramacrobiotus metropolitanus]